MGDEKAYFDSAHTGWTPKAAPSLRILDLQRRTSSTMISDVIPDAVLRWMLNFALPDTLQASKPRVSPLTRRTLHRGGHIWPSGEACVRASLHGYDLNEGLPNEPDRNTFRVDESQ